MTAPRKTDARRLLARLALLPIAERCYVVVLLFCALGPAALRAYAEFAPAGDESLLVTAGRHPMPVMALGVAVAVSALLALEPPRGWRPRAYAAQLRARLNQAQSHYDAEHRRRFPEESNHEVEHPVQR